MTGGNLHQRSMQAAAKAKRDRHNQATRLEKAAVCALADLLGMTAEYSDCTEAILPVCRTIVELHDALDAGGLDLRDYTREVEATREKLKRAKLPYAIRAALAAANKVSE